MYFSVEDFPTGAYRGVVRTVSPVWCPGGSRPLLVYTIVEATDGLLVAAHVRRGVLLHLSSTLQELNRPGLDPIEPWGGALPWADSCA